MLIDERLIRDAHHSSGSLSDRPIQGLGPPPIFTNLKLSTCHWLPDGLLCYVTDIRKTPKLNRRFFKNWRRFKEWEEYGGGGLCILESGITVWDWRSWFIVQWPNVQHGYISWSAPAGQQRLQTSSSWPQPATKAQGKESLLPGPLYF